jgi:malate dehydrogenase (oxaloacetate-decarboxylating)
VLIGVSGQPGTFTERIARAMARHAERPIIFPLSNPTSRSEATPQDLLDWTDGRAIVGTGSPFAPVTIQGKLMPIDQTNNSYIFPGMALGILASKARRVTDAMFMAAARALAALSPTVRDKSGRLLPPVTDIRAVSVVIAEAVAEQAYAEGLATRDQDSGAGGHNATGAKVQSLVWTPEYRPYRHVKLPT